MKEKHAMPHIAGWRKYIAMGIIALTFFGAFMSQEKLDFYSRKEHLVQPYGYVAGNVIGGIVLAGFKGIAVDIIWIMMDETFHSGGWYKVLPYFYTIAYLQPQFFQNWALGAWHMAFNVSLQAKDLGEKRSWILTGIDFDKKGINCNQNRYELYFETGWICYQKANVFENPRRFHDEAIRYMRLAVRFEHPEYIDRLIAHIYRKSGRLEQAIREYERVLKIRPDDNIARRNLEETQSMLRGETPYENIENENEADHGDIHGADHVHDH